MRSAGEHSAPLTLVCGEDWRLVLLGRLLLVFAVVVVLTGALAPWLRICLVVCTLGYGWFAEARAIAWSGQMLRIFPDGRCECAGRHGRVSKDARITDRYTSLLTRDESGTRSLVISASRQGPGEYRKLLAWMRHRRWDD